MDQLQHELVLAIAEPVDRVLVGRVARRTLGQVDVSGGEERPDSLVPGLAVDVLVVVAHCVKLAKLLAAVLRALTQVLVEHRLPRRGVHLCRLRQDPVEIKEAGFDFRRQSDHERGSYRPGPAREASCNDAASGSLA